MGEQEIHPATRQERGASAVEYGLLIAGIAALILAVVFLFGGIVRSMMSDSCGTITAQVKSTC
jgi:pilus assembly protein Flp/PilA